ncbi:MULTISPECIES: helix-turn-helix domain-containing protein [unclassified Streptomyces]|uniref:helix-turn-helix domain-containing protein n=1 Tax=unclassified Streptomyces TaxID=2593676 RepID=UPI00225386C4|nr:MULTISPECIES: helix-turn-helix transcriptional regulator [unclassified Streptomyces]WSP58623.1 helix-turn-helix domain-containing protein [Streptomyces sp. NBC_01241]WSU20799.1 helix-turn-helix domain-containing protein [Streptomyces sp. NBC_01108]MCX4790399.1 helix-turn-helix domain-containing protein [Streptomyces sp. NBC_01221]MCX4793873.1 helix-turn-helix domain-containing protein [Streptomyces sp. NBC_01242]WSJ35288.1 helix-turn-helix domain-containing protein [Streptomyces sp. NBC_013
MPADLPPWILERRRTLGDRIRDRRMHQNLTQEQLAHRAEISRDTIQRIEGAQNDARISRLWRIAAALDTTVASLLGE